MADPAVTPLLELAGQLRLRSVTSVDVVESALRRADDLDAQLGAYLLRFDETALSAARESDARRSAGRSFGPLDGIPVAVKDVVATQEGPTTGQSLVPGHGWAGGWDASVVAGLRAAGAVITGKTTTSEFALGPPDSTKPFPIPRNPWDLGRWPGGSSAGAAAAVAAGLIAGAVATDTGGSTRVPAAFCGVTGFVPTFGILPTHGVIALAPSLDRVGVIARTAAECRAMVEAMAGDTSPYSDACAEPPLQQVRIGVVVDDTAADEPDVRAAFDVAVHRLHAVGAQLLPVRLPLQDALRAAARIAMAYEAFSEHSGTLAQHWEDYYSTTRLRLASGAFVSGADYLVAQAVRRRGREEVAALFARLDVVISPTIGMGAPRYDDTSGIPTFDTVLKLARTSYWSALGAPAISVPMGFTRDGLPIGLQIAAAPHRDPLLLDLATQFQAVTEWHLQTPSLTRSSEPAARPADPRRLTADEITPADAVLTQVGLRPHPDELAALRLVFTETRVAVQRLRAVALGA